MKLYKVVNGTLFLFCLICSTLVYADKDILMNQEQKHIFDKLSKQHGFDERIESITKNFTIKELENENGFSVLLLSKGPERLSLSITFVGGGGFHHDGFNPPQGLTLNGEQIEVVNEVFHKQNKLWMFAPENASLLAYDLSNGYEGLARQKLFSRTSDKESKAEVTTRIDGDIATIYYKNSDSMSLFDDSFYINMDIKNKSIISASWIDLRLKRNNDVNFEARMMSDDEFKFINKSLIRGGYPGLEELIKTDKVGLSFGLDEYNNNKPTWTIGTDPIKGNGHSLIFTIDAETGETTSPLTMHMIPSSPVPNTPVMPDLININEQDSLDIPLQELNYDEGDKVKVISLFPNKPYALDDDTSITVMSILEKRMSPDRRSVMKITLKFKHSNKSNTVVFDSDHPDFSWNNYKFEYMGGWRNKVELKVLN